MELQHDERVASSDRRERVVESGALAVPIGQAVVEVDTVLVTPQVVLVVGVGW